MVIDQLRAELDVTFRTDLVQSSDLTKGLEEHFTFQTSDAVTCAKGTTLEGLTNTLAQVVFAKNRDTVAALYIRETSSELKIHIEHLSPTTLADLPSDLDLIKRRVAEELDRVRSFAKTSNNKVSSVKITISCDKYWIAKATEKSFWTRWKERLEENVRVRLTIPVATAATSLLIGFDLSAAGKAFGGGIVAVFIATFLEAVSGESLKYERGY